MPLYPRPTRMPSADADRGRFCLEQPRPCYHRPLFGRREHRNVERGGSPRGRRFELHPQSGMACRPSGPSSNPQPYLYLNSFAGQRPRRRSAGTSVCVGAAGSESAALSVVTALGLRLGDPVARVRQIYGAAANFVPTLTSGGIDPNPVTSSTKDISTWSSNSTRPIHRHRDRRRPRADDASECIG